MFPRYCYFQKNVAVNILVQTYESLSIEKPRRVNLRLKILHILNFYGYCQLLSKRVRTNLYSHQQTMRALVFPNLWQDVLFNAKLVEEYWWHLIVIWIWIYPRSEFVIFQLFKYFKVLFKIGFRSPAPEMVIDIWILLLKTYVVSPVDYSAIVEIGNMCFFEIWCCWVWNSWHQRKLLSMPAFFITMLGNWRWGGGTLQSYRTTSRRFDEILMWYQMTIKRNSLFHTLFQNLS